MYIYERLYMYNRTTKYSGSSSNGSSSGVPIGHVGGAPAGLARRAACQAGRGAAAAGTLLVLSWYSLGALLVFCWYFVGIL